MKTRVLLYHDVAPADQFGSTGFQGTAADIYKLDTELFRCHLALMQRGYPDCPVLVGEDRQNLKPNSLLLTFDDGGAAAILYTAPLLEAAGWRGHFFVTTDRISSPGFVTESQIVALHRRGHVIGSHSCSHPQRMTACSADRLRSEWLNSKQRLERILQAPVLTASVPGGYYSSAVARAASDAGIRYLFTSEPVSKTWMEGECEVFGRFSVQQGVSDSAVEALINGAVGVRVGQYLLWNGKKIVKTLAGDAWLSFRRKVLAHRAHQKSRTRSAGERSSVGNP